MKHITNQAYQSNKNLQYELVDLKQKNQNQTVLLTQDSDNDKEDDFMAPSYDLSRFVAVMSDRFEIGESHNVSDVLGYLI